MDPGRPRPGFFLMLRPFFFEVDKALHLHTFIHSCICIYVHSYSVFTGSVFTYIHTLLLLRPFLFEVDKAA